MARQGSQNQTKARTSVHIQPDIGQPQAKPVPIQEAIVPEEVEANPDAEEIGIVIEHLAGQRQEAADEAYADMEMVGQYPGIRMKSCGMSMNFKSAEDVPVRNLPCPCGRRNHFAIKYKRVKEL